MTSTVLSEVGQFKSPLILGDQAIPLDPSIWGDEAPKFFLVWWSGQTVDGIDTNYIFGFGIGIDSSNRFCISSISEDDKSTSNAYDRQIGRICELLGLSANEIENADMRGIDPLTPEAVNISWNKVDPSNEFIYNFAAVGGNEFSNVDVRFYTSPEVEGIVSYTDPGFEPDGIIAISVGQPNNNITVWSLSCLGFFDGETSLMVWNASEHDRGTSECGRILNSTDFIGLSSADALTGPFSLAKAISLDLKGFSLDWVLLGDTSPRIFIVLAIKGPTCKVIFDTTPATEIVKPTSLSMTGLFGLLATTMASQSSDTEEDARIGIGAIDLTGNQRFCGAVDENNKSTTNSDSVSSDKILTIIDHEQNVIAEATGILANEVIDMTWSPTTDIQWGGFFMGTKPVGMVTVVDKTPVIKIEE